jgi:hypothetical protein
MLDAASIGVSGESQSDKERLEQLREALHGAFRSLGRDECGTYRLLGSRGHRITGRGLSPSGDRGMPAFLFLY